MQESKPLAVASILFWLACSSPAILAIHEGRFGGIHATGFFIAFAVFGAVLVADSVLTLLGIGRDPLRPIVMYTLLVAGFTMVYFSSDITRYASSVTLALAASRLPRMTTERRAWLGVIAITAGLLALLILLGEPWPAIFGNSAAVIASLVFVVTFGIQQMREQAARAELAAANAQLLVNRELLAETTRIGERLRISRDLHDSLGHHLTALSIQLDVAARQAAEPASAHIREAHAIAKLLLGDVRDVVGKLRTESPIDFHAEVAKLASNIGSLRVHLDVSESTPCTHSAANTLLRCVQEIITNTRRHAGANNLWIALTHSAEGWELRGRDDGCGTAQVKFGNGLSGMEERAASLVGRVEVDSDPAGGFSVRVLLPNVETQT